MTSGGARTIPGVQIRKAASSKDLDLIRDLMLICGVSTIRARISATLDGSTWWLAFRDGIEIGCIGLEYGDGASLIRSVAVEESERNLGLGDALVNTALDAARARKDAAVYLFSKTDDFWQRYGFQPVEMDELVAALPEAPQVLAGLQWDWLEREQAWKLVL